MATDPEKISAVRDWALPQTLRELRAIIGFASYYGRYVPRFTQLAMPIHRVVKAACQDGKGRRSLSTSRSITETWTEECQHAFDALKLALTSAPVHGFANYRLPFIVETDASDRGVGAVLSHQQDGRRRIIAYASRGLRGAERNDANYSSMKLETLALKWAVTDKFRDYLLGGTFVVYTDNNPLTYFKQKAKLSAVEQRWAAALAPFDFTIKYRPGRSNANTDGLFRQHDVAASMECNPDCDTITILTEVTETSTITSRVRVTPMEHVVNTRYMSEIAITTLPGISNDDMISMQETDSAIGRLRHYRQTTDETTEGC